MVICLRLTKWLALVIALVRRRPIFLRYLKALSQGGDNIGVYISINISQESPFDRSHRQQSNNPSRRSYGHCHERDAGRFSVTATANVLVPNGRLRGHEALDVADHLRRIRSLIGEGAGDVVVDLRNRLLVVGEPVADGDRGQFGGSGCRVDLFQHRSPLRLRLGAREVVVEIAEQLGSLQTGGYQQAAHIPSQATDRMRGDTYL